MSAPPFWMCQNEVAICVQAGAWVSGKRCEMEAAPDSLGAPNNEVNSPYRNLFVWSCGKCRKNIACAGFSHPNNATNRRVFWISYDLFPIVRRENSIEEFSLSVIMELRTIVRKEIADHCGVLEERVANHSAQFRNELG